MRIHRSFHLAAALAISAAGTFLVLSAHAQTGSPARHSGIVIFETAEFVVDRGSRPPDDSAAWEAVSLPHEWRRTHPDTRGEGWYRIKFELAPAPRRAQAINIHHIRSNWVEFFVNGGLIGGSVDTVSGRGGFGTPLYLTIPPALLHAGENVIHARMKTVSYPINVDGLGRVTFGDARPVRRVALLDLELGFYAERAFLVMGFVAGLITLFVWSARRSDRVILWYSITCLSWALAGALWSGLRWLDLPVILSVLSLYVAYGLVVPAVILCLRTAGLRWPWFEVILWTYLIIEVTHRLWLDGTNVLMRLGWDVANAALLLAGIVIMLHAVKRPLRWPYKMQVAALSMMAVLMVYEVARYLGWVDIESPVFRQYHVPIMLLAIGTAIFERHVVAVWRMEQSNLELERRVAEKAREIQAYHAERDDVMRQQTLARERQRIVSDMHDGLGASLIALLRYVQGKGLDAHLEQRVKEALQELRISIDALEPSEGDLGAVLGNLRYRLEPLLEPAGVHLEWEVAELPQIEALEPSAVFALQRIVLEAVANALKHSGATRVRLSAQAAADGGVEIRVEDDGRGFDAAHPTAGLGLANMRARAARIGAQVEISSSAGRGTVVRLQIPRLLQVSAEDKVSGKPDPRGLHELVPAVLASTEVP